MPYFINLAPSYDLTLIPTYLSKQGLLGEVDWRQRLSNGQYSIRADRDRRAAAEPLSRPIPTAPATSGCAARSRRRATSSSTRTGSSAGTSPGCPTSSSPTTTSCRASTSATIISRTSFRRSTCAGRPITASSTSAPTISRARRPTTTTARCLLAAPVFDYNRVFALPGGPHLRARRRGDDRRQRRQHRPDQRGLPVDRPADVRQRLPPLQRLRDGGRRQIREHLLSRRVHAAQHRRRLRPRIRPGLVAAQLHRPDRRSLEAVRLRPPRRRSDRAQRDRLDHLRERDRIEHGRQLEPGGVLLGLRSGRVRPRHGGRRPRIPLSVRADDLRGARRRSRRSPSSSSVRTRSFRASSRTRTPRASSSTRRTCSPGTSSPATTGSRAARGSTTASSTRPISPTADTPTSSAGESIQVAGQNSYTLFDVANTGLESGLDKKILQLRGRRDDPADLGSDLVHQQAAVRQFDVPARPLRRHRQGDASPASPAASTMRSTRRSRRLAGSIRARA